MLRRQVARSIIGVGAVLMAAAIAAGCGGGKEPGKVGEKLAAKSDQVFTLNISSDPEGFDPAKASYVDTLNVINQMYVGMYRLQGPDNEVVPYLATELPTISDGGLTYTVKLRDDAKWTNGDPVTAEDIVYGVRYSLNPKTAAYFSGFMTSIVGACESLAAGDAAALKGCGDKPTDGKPESIGVRAVDEHTVEFKLKQQVPWFTQLLTVNTFYPLPGETIDKFGAKWTDVKNIVSNGPFQLDKYTRRKSVELKKSETFWDADKVTLQHINMIMVGDAKTAIKQFELGKLDTGFARTMVPPSDIDKWKTDDRYVSVDTSSTNYMYLNTRNEALKDPKVRQGIAVAVDRQTLVNNITKRGDVPLDTVIPTVLPGYDTIKQGAQEFIGAGSAPDVDKAKELLKEGGWKDGTELSLYFDSGGATGGLVSQSIQSDLSKVGVKVKLVPTPGDVMQTPGVGVSPIGEKVDLLLQGWGADYLDAQDYYQLFTCDNVDAGINGSNYCDEEFDKLYNESLKVVDDDARFDIYKQLEAMLTGPEGAMPAVPLYQPKDDTVVQSWVKGFNLEPSSFLWLDDVQILEHDK